MSGRDGGDLHPGDPWHPAWTPEGSPPVEALEEEAAEEEDLHEEVLEPAADESSEPAAVETVAPEPEAEEPEPVVSEAPEPGGLAPEPEAEEPEAVGWGVVEPVAPDVGATGLPDEASPSEAASSSAAATQPLLEPLPPTAEPATPEAPTATDDAEGLVLGGDVAADLVEDEWSVEEASAGDEWSLEEGEVDDADLEVVDEAAADVDAAETTELEDLVVEEPPAVAETGYGPDAARVVPVEAEPGPADVIELHDHQYLAEDETLEVVETDEPLVADTGELPLLLAEEPETSMAIDAAGEVLAHPEDEDEDEVDEDEAELVGGLGFVALDDLDADLLDADEQTEAEDLMWQEFRPSGLLLEADEAVAFEGEHPASEESAVEEFAADLSAPDVDAGPAPTALVPGMGDDEESHEEPEADVGGLPAAEQQLTAEELIVADLVRDMDDEDVDFEAFAREDFAGDDVTASATQEHMGLAAEVAEAERQEAVPGQALVASVPGMDTGVVGFEDVEEAEEGEGPPEAGAEEETPRQSELTVRVASALLLAAVFVAALWAGGIVFLVFIALVAIVGQGEFYAALRRAEYRPLALVGLGGGLGSLIGAYWAESPVAVAAAVAVTTVVVFAWYGSQDSPPEHPYRNGVVTVLGVGWISGLLSFAFPIAAVDTRIRLILAALITAAAHDIGSYFVGRSLGRRQLAPRLSPGKTVEGLVGGTIAALAVGLVIGLVLEPFTAGKGLALAAALAVASPLGDLAESTIKRSLGVKDLGAILPGHGGVLDRVDAYLFAVVAAYIVYRWTGLLPG